MLLIRTLSHREGVIDPRVPHVNHPIRVSGDGRSYCKKKKGATRRPRTPPRSKVGFQEEMDTSEKDVGIKIARRLY